MTQDIDIIKIQSRKDKFEKQNWTVGKARC